MKLAMVVTGGLHPSGHEQVVPSWLSLFTRLARRHDVHAFALRHLPRAQSYPLFGFTVHDLGRPGAPLGFTKRAQARVLLRAMHGAGPFDLVHGFWGDPAGQLAVRSARHFGVPSVVTLDSGEFVALPDIGYGSQRTARGRSAVREAATATAIHVCSEFMRAQSARHGVTATVIPLTTVEAAPAEARVSSTRVRLLQVASLSRVKNQRLLIDALARVCQKADAELDLAGEDTLGGELQRHAASLGLADRVHFHGFVPHDALAPLYGRASLYVQSSLHEAAGVSVLEAAAAGVPVTGTRAGYLADWAPEMAVAIDRADPDTLARAILAIHADPSRMQAVAARARAWALEHDADRMTSGFEQLYGSLARLP
jgi:glycosyltransferase involved in cell wall biosynthesis